MTTKDKFYQRQITLSEVGFEGQEKLSNSHVLVIGAGGLGCPVLEYIAAAGIGHITICDFDKIDYTNLHRQVLYNPSHVDQYKAVIAKDRLNTQNPHIKVETILEPFDIHFDISKYDLVIDCSDNFKTKFSSHDLCYQNKIALIQGSIHKFEGQIQVYRFDSDDKSKPCLRCLWPKAPEKTCVQTCSEAGVLGVVPGVIGSMQASEAIKYLLGLPTLQTGQNLMINLFDFSTQKIKWSKDGNCPLCQNEKISLESFKYGDSEFEINFNELNNKDYTLINVTGKSQSKLSCTITTDLKNLLLDVSGLSKDSDIVLVCNRGVTSLKATHLLRENGFNNCFSLKDGINSL